MKLIIKNMVCDRCVMAVRRLLDSQDIAYKNVQLGEVELVDNLKEPQEQQLREELSKLGFELLDDKKAALATRIKSVIISLIHNTDATTLNKKLSVLISEKLHMDYSYLSALFSAIEDITIEKYVILQRIERVKELMMYDEMNLNEIADQLGYSSVQHLSLQFKKVTGLSPSHFRQLKENKRKPLDRV